MKVLIAPDKFKGSLTSLEVCEAVEKGILNVLPNAKITKLPLADGGEGSLTALESTLRFKRKHLSVHGPLFNPIETWYGYKDNIALIEMAKASGLELLQKNERNPKLTSSFGTGELIIDAIKNGAKYIYLFIGGSSTNDAAIGIASAFGFKFFDSSGAELKPIGENLINIRSIKYFPVIKSEDIKFMVLSDVQNPFYGENGAAHVYAKQKGADESTIIELDNGLRNIAKRFNEFMNKDISNIPGSGAAGGIGGGMVAFFDAQIKSGIDTIFEMLNFDELLRESSLVITGEGKFDSQTLEGKVVKGVMDKSKLLNKTIGVLCGVSTLTEDEINSLDIVVNQIKSDEINIDDSIQNAYTYLLKRTEELIKELIKN